MMELWDLVEGSNSLMVLKIENNVFSLVIHE